MALARPAREIDISVALDSLRPLPMDSYFIAFGPGSTQFCGTPNGYSTYQLPSKVIRDLVNPQVNQVLCGSFGDVANSYFFTYKMRNGTSTHCMGRDVPEPLKVFVRQICNTSPDMSHSLRVKLGAHGSFVAWAGRSWICDKVPAILRDILQGMSSWYNPIDGAVHGVLKSGTLENVAWHGNGSYFVETGTNSYANFETIAVKKAWAALWHGQKLRDPKEMANLAYVAFNPHSPTGETFAFIKKAQQDGLADFILRFEPEEEVVYRLTDSVHQDTSTSSTIPVIPIPCHREGQKVYRWAYCNKAGRPHASDLWELDLKKGERLKIIKDMGKDWFVVERTDGTKGWAHASQLDFQEMRAHIDPREAYIRFTTDIAKLLQAGSLRSFPVLSQYLNVCGQEACKATKQNKDGRGLDICVHDLHELMRGSGRYSLEMLRGERNKWHPDRFARFCHVDHRESIREKAQALFVLYGVLMDRLENPPASGNEI